MGLSCSPSASNWADNTNFYKQVNHRLVDYIPFGQLTWRMPTSPEEVSWGTCLTHSLYCNGRGFDGPHQLWQVTALTGAQVLAYGDGSPYLVVTPYVSGNFIYDAALQPLLGHGGFAPGMYVYTIFRRAIEWAFESAQRPVVKLSPWPYKYDAAFMIRHDLENFADEVADILPSASIEYSNGAWGDYYFCTGAITNDPIYSFDYILPRLQEAVDRYGATIGPHNGGLPNPRATGNSSSCCFMNAGTYEYWHWGPDEALDFAGGRDYASNSLAISFAQIETWLTNQPASQRVWVAPYFNGTRENSYEAQEELDVKITGDQKLTPFPAWTLSTRIDGKRYALLSEPASEWFVDGWVAQSLDPWHDGVHDTNTIHNAVDFYYSNGFLINLYSHGLSTGDAGPRPYPQTAGRLIPEYIHYCMDSQRFPGLWSSNARGVYDWWLKRSSAQVTASYTSTNGTHSLATIAVRGAQNTNTAVEINAPGFGSVAVALLRTNGVITTNNYRTVGEVLKILVGNTVTNVEAEYFPGPAARDDFYSATQGQVLTVGQSAGVLSNDFSGTWTGLSAILSNGPSHGELTVTSDGGFDYKPADGFWGTECFTYQAMDGPNALGIGTVTISVTATNGQTPDLYSDDFVRCKETALNPWQLAPSSVSGQWGLAGGTMQGTHATYYGYCYLGQTWANYSVEAQVRFASGSYGGGLGACLTPSSGAHYAAWLYPGLNLLRLVKFNNWSQWGNDGTDNHVALKETNLPPIGTDWHPLKLVCSKNVLQVYYHGTNVISTSDTNWYSSGGVSLDIYAGAISVSNLIVTPLQ
jgi:hypothetical protein